MMESKTKPKKKGFNLFDDDDDDIEEDAAVPAEPFISKDPVPEGSKTTTTVTSSNNVMAGSGAAATTPKFGQQAQQQPVHNVPASKPVTTSAAGQQARSFVTLPTATTAASIHKPATTPKKQARRLPANTFISASNKIDSTGKPVTTSKLGHIFGSRLTTTATMTNSINENVTTTSTPANPQVQYTRRMSNSLKRMLAIAKPCDPGFDPYSDAEEDAPSSEQPPQTRILHNAPTVAATSVEQQLPSVKASTVTSNVATQGCPLLSKYQPVPMRPLERKQSHPIYDVSEESTDEEELQLVKAPTIVQQPKAAVEEASPVLSEFQAVKTDVVEQNSETSSSIAAIPSKDLDDNLGLALLGLPQKDFAFMVKSDQIPIHKVVLAVRSPYFYQQFFEHSGSIPDFENIDDYDKEVVELAVHACYGQYFDETTLDEHIVEQLIKFADHYGMRCVKDLLPQTMAKVITEETVCAAAVLSYDTNDYELRRKCANFIAGLILQHQPIPRGIEELPVEFNKEIVLAIAAKYKKQ